MKRMTVLDWLSTLGHATENIETEVRFGSMPVCLAKGPRYLEEQGPVGVLEARLNYVTITGERITIQATPKAYTM